MLLVRLIPLAASLIVAAASVSFLRKGAPAPPKNKVLKDPSKDGQFHKRGKGAFPNVPDQKYKITVKCVGERDALAKELNEVMASQKKLDVQCKRDVNHLKNMNVLTERQIKKLKPIVSDRKDESDLPPMYRAQYTAIMCGRVHAGYFMNDQKARRQIDGICAGNKSLADYRLLSLGKNNMGQGDHTGDASVNWAGYYKAKKKKLANFFHGAEDAAASPECFQAQALQKQVDSTRKAMKTKEAVCKKKTAKLRTKLVLKRKKEQALWTQYHGHISKKGPIKKKEAEKVATKFCVVVQAKSSGLNCGKTKLATIKAYHSSHCLP